MKLHRAAISSVSSPLVGRSPAPRFALYKSPINSAAASSPVGKILSQRLFRTKPKRKVRKSEGEKAKFADFPRERDTQQRPNRVRTMIEEELREVRDSPLGIDEEIWTLRHIFQSVIDQCPEFRAILVSIRSRYERLVKRTWQEMECSQVTLKKVNEENSELLRRIDTVSRLHSPATAALPRMVPRITSNSEISPSTEGCEYLIGSTERRNPVYREECGSDVVDSDLDILPPSPTRKFPKPDIVPKLKLHTLKEPDIHFPRQTAKDQPPNP